MPLCDGACSAGADVMFLGLTVRRRHSLRSVRRTGNCQPTGACTSRKSRADDALFLAGLVALMEVRQPLTERAFTLARSGEVTSLPELRKRLDREGYRAADIQGPTLNRQLIGLIRESRAPQL
jgi:hypothetical protein